MSDEVTITYKGEEIDIDRDLLENILFCARDDVDHGTNWEDSVISQETVEAGITEIQDHLER